MKVPRGWCRAHAWPKPCDACARVSASQRLIWQRPERRKRHIEMLAHRTKGAPWTREEDAIIRRHANVLPRQEIARLCTQESGVQRSAQGVSRRANEDLGIVMNEREVYALWGVGRTVAKVFGVHANTVCAWEAAGYIKSREWGKFHVYDEAEIQRFIREQPWAYDVEKMQRGPLRSLAEVIQKRQPWYRVPALAVMLGMRDDTIYAYARKGIVRSRQRNGHNGAVLIRGEDIPLIVATRDANLRGRGALRRKLAA